MKASGSRFVISGASQALPKEGADAFATVICVRRFAETMRAPGTWFILSTAPLALKSKWLLWFWAWCPTLYPTGGPCPNWPQGDFRLRRMRGAGGLFDCAGLFCRGRPLQPGRHARGWLADHPCDDGRRDALGNRPMIASRGRGAPRKRN